MKVLANDLNPQCFNYLQQNIKLNKVQKLIIPFNMDARLFAKKIVEMGNDSSQDEVGEDFLRFDHVYMNLPVDAVEFLDVFVGLFNKANQKVWTVEGKWKLPLMHVNGFTYEAERPKALKYFAERIGKAMRYKDFREEDI